MRWPYSWRPRCHKSAHRALEADLPNPPKKVMTMTPPTSDNLHESEPSQAMNLHAPPNLFETGPTECNRTYSPALLNLIENGTWPCSEPAQRYNCAYLHLVDQAAQCEPSNKMNLHVSALLARIETCERDRPAKSRNCSHDLQLRMSTSGPPRSNNRSNLNPNAIDLLSITRPSNAMNLRILTPPAKRDLPHYAARIWPC